MAVSIPAALNLRPLAASYAIDPEPLIVSEVDEGEQKQRPRSTHPIRRASATFRMLRSVYRDTFLDWYAGDLEGGSAWFDWVEPLSGEAVEVLFDGKSPPGARPVPGGRVAVQARLLVRAKIGA